MSEPELTAEERVRIWDPLESEIAADPEADAAADAELDRLLAERKQKGEAPPEEEPRPSTVYPDYF